MTQEIKSECLTKHWHFYTHLEAVTNTKSPLIPEINAFGFCIQPQKWRPLLCQSLSLSSFCRDLCLWSSQHVALLHRPRWPRDRPRPGQDVLRWRRPEQVWRGGSHCERCFGEIFLFFFPVQIPQLRLSHWQLSSLCLLPKKWFTLAWEGCHFRLVTMWHTVKPFPQRPHRQWVSLYSLTSILSLAIKVNGIWLSKKGKK